MSTNFISKKIGRCLTEYRHPDLTSLLFYFDFFIAISQFEVQYSDGDLCKHENLIKTNAKCGYGEILYGVDSNNKVTQLMSIIDSSD